MVSGTQLRCAGETHPGVVRSNNEDRVYLDPDRGIFLVIDGIGGHAAGEMAADIALKMIRSRLERQTGSAGERIQEAIAVANNEISRLARTNPDWAGMACVLTVVVVDDGSAAVGHVGDSRLYKIRGGRISKITHDHSPVGEREDSNDISEIEAMRHPRRNEVYRDVGSQEHAPDDPEFIELTRIDFEPDSALLLCSDGLSDQVTSAEILRVVERGAGDPGAAVRELIAAANRAGGKDNVSAIIVEGPEFSTNASPLAAAGRRRKNFFPGPWRNLIFGFIAGLLLLAALQSYFGWLDSSRLHAPTAAAPRVLVAGALPGAQFGAINDALAQARSGDTIELLAGEYREQIRLREGINLISRIPHAAIIRATAISSGPQVAIIADHVKAGRVTGVRILADDKMPLAVGIVLADSDIEISDSEISGAGIGIEIRGASKPVIRANSIHDCVLSGVVISGASTAWLSHNDIIRNGRMPRDRRPGVLVVEPSRPVLVGNIFADNGGESVAIPREMDSEPILKFNYFLSGKPLGRTLPGAAGSSPGRGGRWP